MTDEDQKKARMNWLDEHDSIQLELLKMKEDIVKEPDTISKDSEDQKEKSAEKDTHLFRNDIPDQIEEDAKGSQAETSPIPEPTYRQEALKPKNGDDGSQGEPPKLPKGKIPASPDLTRKIANVIQLENKLKRRKYELEKKERAEKERKVKGEGAEEKVVKEAQEPPKTEARPERKLSPPPEFPEDKPEPIESSKPVNSPEISDQQRPANETDISGQGDPKMDSSNGVSTKNAVRRRMIIRRRAPVTGDKEQQVVKAIEVEDSSSGSDSESSQMVPGSSGNEVKNRGPLKGLSRFFKKGKDTN